MGRFVNIIEIAPITALAGVGTSRPGTGLRRCLLRAVFPFRTTVGASQKRDSHLYEVRNSLGQNAKGPKWGLSHCGGERGIQLARFASSLPTCRCAAALVEQGSKAQNSLGRKTKRPREGAFSFSGGERGIRTLGTVSPYTRFPGEHLKPLSHLSESCALA